ncbi:MAG: hypothetical protein RMX96_19770 [Nostoc sp. ChiSLP02]|nr:hypothetical protein [Nostoc sp. DedSLP05]MDZ8097483.1 hypothetical protein [Nostoc sp. DedSLP01]MDZ8187072.1 hypothetical protein [Nostoc sp. ChiSLP02]
MDTDGKLEIYKENKFPNLSRTEYSVTSKQSTLYNCFAWAAGEDNRWWSPIDPDNTYYWVEGITPELTMSAFIQAYESLGYELCNNSDLEAGFEKIAIYATSDGEPTHAARQLLNGKWTSKLGRWEDIEHELEGLIGEMYGDVKQILKRPSSEVAQS